MAENVLFLEQAVAGVEGLEPQDKADVRKVLEELSVGGIGRLDAIGVDFVRTTKTGKQELYVVRYKNVILGFVLRGTEPPSWIVVFLHAVHDPSSKPGTSNDRDGAASMSGSEQEVH